MPRDARHAEELRRWLGRPEIVAIERRDHPTEPRLNGFVLGVSSELCLFHAFHDFQPDGYTIIRLRGVSAVVREDSGQCWDQMLAKEGLLGGLNLDTPIDLNSMAAAVRSVHRKFGRMIIECEEPEEDLEDFYIGSLVRLSGGVVIFDHFDTCGRWSPEPAEIADHEITLVQFETPYIRTFWRHLDGDPPNAAPVVAN